MQAPASGFSSVSGTNVGRQSWSTERAPRSTSASGANACRVPSGRTDVRSSIPTPSSSRTRAPHQSPTEYAPGAGGEGDAEIGRPQRRRLGGRRADGLAVPAPDDEADCAGRRGHRPLEREDVAAGARLGRLRDGVERAVGDAVGAAGEPGDLDPVAVRELDRRRRRERDLVARDRRDRDRSPPVLERPGEPRRRLAAAVEHLDAEEPVGKPPERVAGRRAGVGRHGGRGAGDREQPRRAGNADEAVPGVLAGGLGRRHETHPIADAGPGGGVDRGERRVDELGVLRRLDVLLEDIEVDERPAARRQRLDLILRGVGERRRGEGEHPPDPDPSGLDVQVERAARGHRDLEVRRAGDDAGEADDVRRRRPRSARRGVEVEVPLVVEEDAPLLHPRARPAVVEPERDLRVVAGHHSSQEAMVKPGRRPSGTNSWMRRRSAPTRAARRAWL